MQSLSNNDQLPVYRLQQDGLGGTEHFRIYNFEGTKPTHADLLTPHRKNHYLFVFIRKAGNRQWIDMEPYTLSSNRIYFSGPNQIIVKEGIDQLWSTGIAFTEEFLSHQENACLRDLPVIQNPLNRHELILSNSDIKYVEDVIGKMNDEYQNQNDWRQPMVTAHLTVLLTYLSRLYTEQFQDEEVTVDRQLLKNFKAALNTSFVKMHEVSQYASALHISVGHLSAVIKSQSGKPAIKHIHERLALEAARRLFHTEDSLKEIAFSLGFNDISYFGRFFKRETGLTPANYRSKMREMYQ